LIHEQTIRLEAACSGIGLHSGAPVNMRILPAAAGTGIVFRRTDLDGFQIEANSRNVAKVSYATSLMKKGVLISTTEHLLSACVGVGLDNAIVELDNLELPLLDGSAQPFVDMILNAGLRKQRRPRTYYRIRRDLELHEGDKFIGVYPGPGYSVSYAIDFPHPLIGKEVFEVELKNMGLIRGASMDNVIVLTEDSVLNGPLRFQDEFVRHKVLDLIGDLALLGRRIIGRVVANRAGHAMHTAIVSRLLKDPSLWEETTDEHLPTPLSATELRATL